MGRIVDLFEHERTIPLDGMGLLLGDPTGQDHASETFASWADLATAQEVGSEGVNDLAVVEIVVRYGARDFLVPVVEWSRLVAQPEGADIITGNDTALEAFEVDGNGETYLLVGRSDENRVMVKQGAGLNPAGQVTLTIRTRTVSGGILNRMIHGVGQRHFLALQADQDARPTPSDGLRYNGINVGAAVNSDGVTWYPSGDRPRSTTVKTWFEFGESSFDPLTGIWDVSDNWIVVDGSQSSHINFSANWDGPWSSPYDSATHKYARIRLADGSLIVRRVGISGGPINRQWIPLTEQYVDGSAYRASPYTARTAFDFTPSEFRLLRWEWEWAGASYDDVIDGETYRQRVEKIVSAQSIVGSPEQTRSSVQWATRRFGPVWSLRANRERGLDASRTTAMWGNGANSNDVRMAVQFESSDAADVTPITHIRFIERAAGSQSVTGWLRSYVL